MENLVGEEDAKLDIEKEEEKEDALKNTDIIKVVDVKHKDNTHQQK